jgi:hypothetical protein
MYRYFFTVFLKKDISSLSTKLFYRTNFVTEVS